MPLTNRTIALVAMAAALLFLPATANARLPPEFVGISPQTHANKEDFELMRGAGLRSVRLPLYWTGIERYSPAVVKPDWSDFDRSVMLAAQHGMRVFPFVWGTPRWVAPEPEVEPLRESWASSAWASFLRRAVVRYGAEGTFWRDHPDVTYLPINAWEVWNEQNIVTFSANSSPERYARLIRISGRVIHRADPSARAILGGLFGRPLQIPPNIGSGDFLKRLYKVRGVKQHFDGVALHPYVADAFAMRAQIRNLRRVMKANGDAATPLYITELGWGSDSFQTRWERGLRGQARELDQAFGMLAGNRHKWRIGGVWWFSWSDIQGGCQFCDSAGLLTEGREAKPAWYRFTAWTGGDPDIVPRASFGD